MGFVQECAVKQPAAAEAGPDRCEAVLALDGVGAIPVLALGRFDLPRRRRIA